MSKLKVKILVKSNKLRTTAGQAMSMRRTDTNPCMLERKTFSDCAAEIIGGKSKLDEKMANNMRANVARPKRRGNWLGGHG